MSINGFRTKKQNPEQKRLSKFAEFYDKLSHSEKVDLTDCMNDALLMQSVHGGLFEDYLLEKALEKSERLYYRARKIVTFGRARELHSLVLEARAVIVEFTDSVDKLMARLNIRGWSIDKDDDQVWSKELHLNSITLFREQVHRIPLSVKGVYHYSFIRGIFDIKGLGRNKIYTEIRDKREEKIFLTIEELEQFLLDEVIQCKHQ